MPLRKKSADVLIIGGGIIGCAIAYYVAKSGLKVHIVERGTIGGQASGVAGGLIAPSGQISGPGAYADFVLPSLRLFPALSEELRDESGIDIGLDCCGSLRLAFSDQEATELQKKMPMLRELGFPMEWLSTEDAFKLDSSITPNCQGAAYCPNEGQVIAQRLIAAYAEGACRHKAQITKAKVTRILFKGTTAIGIETQSKGQIFAKDIIIANGAWSAFFGETIGYPIPVVPMKGQIATVRNMENAPKHIIFGGDLYVAQKRDGSTVVGATKESEGYDQRTTIAGLLELFTQAAQFIPTLQGATLGTLKSGLRPRTPDKLPIIGPIPGYSGLSIATGHNSNGILMSALTGQIMIAQIIEAISPIDAAPYSILRFIRNLA